MPGGYQVMHGQRLLRVLRQALPVPAAIVLLAPVGWPRPAIASVARQSLAAQSGPARPAPLPRLHVVTYRGYRFAVPSSWPVISDTRHPDECVRFDLHAVYLGGPGANQSCPSWLVGATEALLIQPGPAHARRRSIENPVANQVSVTAPGITVTATFDTSPDVIFRILATAGLPAPQVSAPNPARLAASPGPAREYRSAHAGPAASAGAPRRGAADRPSADAASGSRTPATPHLIFRAVPSALPASVGNDVGLGFDVCAAPSPGYMRSWRRYSPYRAIGIYIGGSNRACDQRNLTARWVRLEAAAGWRFVPMYVGPQASFGQLSAPRRQGAAAAADAVQQAERLGFGPMTPLYYDMEAYTAAESASALVFLSAWTREVHRLGYASGVYSSSRSGIADLARKYGRRRFAMPDAIYDALWNGSQNAKDNVYKRGEWSGRRRLHQFSGNVLQTFGGATMDIDQDYLDLALTAPGGTTQAAPGAAQPDRSASVFYEGADHRLWAESRTPRGQWSRADLGGDLSSQPTVVRVGRSDLAVLYRSSTGVLTVVRRTRGRWQRPQSLTIMGVIGGAPRAVAQTNGVIDVFWSGHRDKHLWHGEFNPGQGWTGPQPLYGSLASSPYPVESGTGVVEVFWQGADSSLWRVVRGVGAPWTRPQDLGMGPMGGPPHAVVLGNGETDVFWRGKVPHSVWSAVITPAQHVLGPRNLGGQLIGEPWPVLAAGIEAVFYRSPAGQLWELPRGGNGRWGHAVRLGRIGHLSSAPFGTTGGAGAPLTIFWRDNRLRLWAASLAGHRGLRQPRDLGGRVQ
jgi:hypothetical protein